MLDMRSEEAEAQAPALALCSWLAYEGLPTADLLLVIAGQAVGDRPADERIGREASRDDEGHVECEIYDNRAPYIDPGVHVGRYAETS